MPIYTGEKALKPKDYGVLSELYAWVTFLIILIPLGMETAFFRFINEKEDKDAVFRNSFLTVIGFSGLFFLLIFISSGTIADWLGYPNHSEFVVLIGGIVCIDAITALPMARLRAEKKAKQFSTIHFVAILINIGLNLIIIFGIFNPNEPMEAIMLILLANVIASSVKIAGTYQDFMNIQWRYDKVLASQMLKYSFPLVIAGFAGMINETLDRVMMKPLLISSGETRDYALTQVGVYAACYKLAVIIMIFLQAYRYAAEPFFFSQSKNKDRNKLYAKIMNYFVAAVCLVFLGVTLNIDIFKHFIRNEEYWVGLGVVPILLLANVFYGIYLNQSIWYKLSGQTRFGAYIAIGGAAITVLINLIFIPIYGYWASAWATLLVYALQMVASYVLGQKYYPIKYNLRKFSLYLGLAISIFLLTAALDVGGAAVNEMTQMAQVDIDRDSAILSEIETKSSWSSFSWLRFFVHNTFILFFVFVVWFIEKPPKQQVAT
ncbi:MAG: oligosaccharide flippase family protein [Crocinitomicaceae bacterium]|nr:oligosaccharide flippase family protein [Crocinitomicaceae bacterium]